MPTSFVDGETWSGGFYELAIELGPRDDARLGDALALLSRAAHVDGWYGRRDVTPQRQPRLPGTLAALEEHGHLRGLVHLPSGAEVACGVLCVREAEDASDDGPDWLDFYVPLGALARLDARIGGYPFGDDGDARSLTWRAPLDAWLERVARAVFARVPFRLAAIGFEVSGEVYARDLAGGVPADRYATYLVPARHGLVAHPATR